MKTRKILSVLLAAAMTCAMCLSAGAADVSPCIYDLEKESTHKTVSAGSCSYDCYTSCTTAAPVRAACGRWRRTRRTPRRR